MKSLKYLGASLAVALLAGSSGALAASPCAHNPDALNTSRTINVSPLEFPLVGKEQYLETLPLNDREVVLTFDDGPIPATSPKILEILASQCVKATFFMLGMNVAEAPDLVQRAYDQGHTIGTHTFSHPALDKLAPEKARENIDQGIEAVTEALGPTRRMAPFFRAPYLAITRDVEKHVLSKGQMVWSIDADSLDWTFTTADALVDRTMKEIEKAGKGIILMHDIKAVTVRALPILLDRLKQGGFKIVHVVSTPRNHSTATLFDKAAVH